MQAVRKYLARMLIIDQHESYSTRLAAAYGCPVRYREDDDTYIDPTRALCHHQFYYQAAIVPGDSSFRHRFVLLELHILLANPSGFGESYPIHQLLKLNPELVNCVSRSTSDFNKMPGTMKAVGSCSVTILPRIPRSDSLNRYQRWKRTSFEPIHQR